jgi:hypothetical protein
MMEGNFNVKVYMHNIEGLKEKLTEVNSKLDELSMFINSREASLMPEVVQQVIKDQYWKWMQEIVQYEGELSKYEEYLQEYMKE